MSEENRQIGQAVKKLIGESGVPQIEISTRLGINRSSLSQMLSGTAPLPFERFVGIMEIIGASKEDFEKVRLLYVKREAIKLAVSPEEFSKIMQLTQAKINNNSFAENVVTGDSANQFNHTKKLVYNPAYNPASQEELRNAKRTVLLDVLDKVIDMEVPQEAQKEFLRMLKDMLNNL